VISCLVGGRRVSNLLVRPGKQETKKRKKSMQTKTNRRGLAIGAAIALVGSFFGAAPASFASTDGQYIDIRPLSNADMSNFGGLLTEDFPVYAELKSGTANANANFADGKLMWIVERVSGALDVLAVAATTSSVPGSPTGTGITDATTRGSASNQVVLTGVAAGSTTQSFVSVWAGSTSATLSAKVSTNGTGYAPLYIRAASASGITSSSPNLTVKVTAFIDDLGGQNGKYDSGEWFTTKTITLYASSRVAPTVTLGSPARGDTVVTVSATLTSLNWSNLNLKPFLQVQSTDTSVDWAGTSTYVTVSPALSQDGATARAGVVSFSFALSGSQTLTESTTLSAELRYAGSESADGGVLLGTASTSAVVSSPGVTSLSISAVATADIAGGGTAYNIRANKTYTIRVFAATNSTSVSKAVTVTLSGTALATSSRTVSINGGAEQAFYPAAGISVTTGTNGFGSFTLKGSGFVPGQNIIVSAGVGNVGAAAVTLTVATLSYTVTSDNGNLVSTTPGTSVSIPFTVEDNWEEPLSATNHFLKVTRGGGSPFSYGTTVSYVAIAAGTAIVDFVPAPATATGSATVEVEVVELANGAYLGRNNGAAVTVTVTVTSSALAFSTGLAASRAASVSYFADTVSFKTVTGKVVVPGSAIKVSGETLVFRKSSSVPATSSGTITVFADSTGNYTFDVAGLREGTKTMTLTNGTATTTSLLVVSAAPSDMGSKITWDTTTIESGKTRVITGTLTDMNGNPVDTTLPGYNGGVAGDSGTASITITYTGTAGILVGTMPTETDANGQFKVSVLTSAADSGTLTITAVYMPQGASTVTANKITSVQAVTVAPAAAPEVNAVIGSFNGRWAVRVENAKGSVVSVKAGNRWVKFTSLNNNYLFSRKSVVGSTIAVSVWVDGELQNSQTITIK
jgi:adhesin/invasin